MNKEKYAIESMAMELRRVSLGYYHGSEKTAERFAKEVLKRRDEISTQSLQPYFKKVIDLLPEVLSQKDKEKLAEDALMYSAIAQNYALKYF